MVLGTDNAPFVIALPRNESVRKMKLEQDTDMLKLERDNLLDKLEIIKRNTNEIFQSTVDLEQEYNNLKNTITKKENKMNNDTPAKLMSSSQLNELKESYKMNSLGSQNIKDSKNQSQSMKLKTAKTMIDPEHKILKYPPKKAIVKKF